MMELDVVTGAFGYTGKYIARRLLAMGRRVRTLTGHPERARTFGGAVEAHPFNFENPPALAKSLEGAATLFNTYWVRFPRGKASYETAVANTRTLVRAAEEAGVRRIVHISITNPSQESPLPYFKGKAILERSVIQSTLSHAIIRPTVVFGPEDILINNIAWLVRRFPVFAVPGSGEYKLQPVFVEDLAEIAVTAGGEDRNMVVDAVGPEVYTFNELLSIIARVLGRRPRIVHVSPGATLFFTRLLGYAVRDVLLTREEIAGMMANLLVSSCPPTGRTRLSVWLERNAEAIGAKYASELARHYH
jgi:uncharacterized protein YbjT (DUF2867 family)